MWDLPKGEHFLPGVSAGEIRRLYDDEGKTKPKMRLLCALHRKQGKSIDQIASIANMKRRTVHDCLRRFAERGVEAKDSVKQAGRPPELTLKQRTKLVGILEKGPPRNGAGLWTTNEVRDVIKKKFGVSFVPQHAWRILVSCGFSLQRPRKRHYKSASDAEKETFKKTPAESQGSTQRKGLSWAQGTRPRSA